MGITWRRVAAHNTHNIMYTDKINPGHPEGRLIISERGFRLKDPSLPTSPIPLSEKADALFKHLEDNGFEVQAKERMQKAYEAIVRAKAARNIGRYGKVLQELPEERKYLSWWLLYDYYDMLPDGRRVNCNAAYYRLTPYYQDLIDKCMTAGLDICFSLFLDLFELGNRHSLHSHTYAYNPSKTKKIAKYSLFWCSHNH